MTNNLISIKIGRKNHKKVLKQKKNHKKLIGADDGVAK